MPEKRRSKGVRLPAGVAGGIRDVLTALAGEQRWRVYEEWVYLDAKLRTAVARGSGFPSVLRALEHAGKRLPLTSLESAHRGARRAARALAAWIEHHPEGHSAPRKP